MNDFDVVTGPAPGSAAKLQLPLAQKKSEQRRAASPPSLPSPSRGEGEKNGGIEKSD
jgi:hypothetical protein